MRAVCFGPAPNPLPLKTDLVNMGAEVEAEVDAAGGSASDCTAAGVGLGFAFAPAMSAAKAFLGGATGAVEVTAMLLMIPVDDEESRIGSLSVSLASVVKKARRRAPFAFYFLLHLSSAGRVGASLTPLVKKNQEIHVRNSNTGCSFQ